jgi:hypothetical protein
MTRHRREHQPGTRRSAAEPLYSAPRLLFWREALTRLQRTNLTHQPGCEPPTLPRRLMGGASAASEEPEATSESAARAC